MRSLLELSVELNESSRLHAVLYAACPRTPELTARLAELSSLLVGEVAWHLERAGAGGSSARSRAALVVSAVNAAVHEVVLLSPPGARRRATVDDLVEWITCGIAPPG
jgi:hypothetical protein